MKSNVSRSEFVDSMIRILKEGGNDENAKKTVDIESVIESLTYDYPLLGSDKVRALNNEMRLFLLLKGKKERKSKFRPSPLFFKGVAYVVKNETTDFELARLATFCFVHMFLRFIRDEIFVSTKDECMSIIEKEITNIPLRIWLTLRDRDWVELNLTRNMMDIASESDNESIRAYCLQLLCDRVATCPRDEDTISCLLERYDKSRVDLLNILVRISQSDNFLKSSILRKRLASYADRICKIMSNDEDDDKRILESCVILCRALAQHSSTANVLFKSGCVRSLVVMTKTQPGLKDVTETLLFCAANSTETRNFLSRVPNFHERVTSKDRDDDDDDDNVTNKVLWTIVLSLSRSDLLEKSKRQVVENVLSQIMFNEDEDMKLFVSKRASAERLLRRFVQFRHIIACWSAYKWFCDCLRKADADLRQVFTTKFQGDFPDEKEVPKELREKNSATVRRLQIIIRTVTHLASKAD